MKKVFGGITCLALSTVMVMSAFPVNALVKVDQDIISEQKFDGDSVVFPDDTVDVVLSDEDILAENKASSDGPPILKDSAMMIDETSDLENESSEFVLSDSTDTENIKQVYKVVDLGTRNIAVDPSDADLQIGDNVYAKAVLNGSSEYITCKIYVKGNNTNNIIWDYVGMDIERYLLDAYKEKYGKKYSKEVFDLIIEEGVTEIGVGFSPCYEIKPYKVSLPSTLTRIGELAFASAKISDIVIPGNVKRIEQYAFQNCTDLSSATIEEGVEYIGSGVFEGCSIENIIIPSTVHNNMDNEEISGFDTDVFNSCKKLKKAEFRGNIGYLPEYTFFDCECLETVVFPEQGLKNIGFCAFSRAGIKKFVVPNGVTKIQAEAFSNSSIEEIELPKTLKYLNGFTFCEKLKKVSIKAVDTIERDAFRGCVALEDLIIPEGTKQISAYAFTNSGIKRIHIPASARGIDTDIPYNFGTIRSLGNTDVEVFGVRGSNAEEYAKMNGYKFTATDGVNVSVDQVESFVTRLYRVVLGRTPDAGGLANWTQHLKSKRLTGAQVVEGFYFSSELEKKKLKNEDFVELAYKGIMGRASDAGGKAYWVDALNSGASRKYVVVGFIGSQEFTNLCKEYGITKGTLNVTENRDKNIGATKYCARLYTKALGRGYDVNGLNYWCERILKDKSRANVINIATNGFFHSKEFQDKKLNNGPYVTVLYRTFLDRDPDPSGYAYWKEQLDSGKKTKDQIVSGFAYSSEFNNIMSKYGL